MQVSSPTPQEVRLLQEITRRVETIDDQELLYDFDDVKQAESRGTEAVLNALIMASAEAEKSERDASEPLQKALGRLWETQRSDGAWDWLDFGLEPFETVDAVYHGAALAALAVATTPGLLADKATPTTTGVEKLRAYLNDNFASQNLFNRTWLLLASTRWNDLLSSEQRSALIAEIASRQRDDGGWSLVSLGGWRWSKPAAPFQAPGMLDASLVEKSDGYATGLIVYTFRQAGIAGDHPAVRNGLRWLRTNQQDVQLEQGTHRAWRAHSLNFDREHGGSKGEPWRRMFMSDGATAFAVLALVGSD
jgi:squalene-hopene/tetraprenyl-beta-curcumene cyclase